MQNIGYFCLIVAKIGKGLTKRRKILKYNILLISFRGFGVVTCELVDGEI